MYDSIYSDKKQNFTIFYQKQQGNFIFDTIEKIYNTPQEIIDTYKNVIFLQNDFLNLNKGLQIETLTQELQLHEYQKNQIDTIIKNLFN